MRPAISFLKSKNFPTFCEEKIQLIIPRSGYCTPFGVYTPISTFLQPDYSVEIATVLVSMTNWNDFRDFSTIKWKISNQSLPKLTHRKLHPFYRGRYKNFDKFDREISVRESQTYPPSCYVFRELLYTNWNNLNLLLPVRLSGWNFSNFTTRDLQTLLKTIISIKALRYWRRIEFLISVKSSS